MNTFRLNGNTFMNTHRNAYSINKKQSIVKQKQSQIKVIKN